MIFCNSKLNDIDSESAVFYLSNYFPYWNNIYRRERNKYCNQFSINLLNLKNKVPAMIEFFSNLLESLISTDFVICTVPSCDPENQLSGINLLAQNLVRKKNIVDGTGCLKRIKKIPKLSHGGERSLGMGIHNQLKYIIHLQICDPISYVQQIGRIGQEDLPAEAYLLYNEKDLKLPKYFIENGSLDYNTNNIRTKRFSELAFMQKYITHQHCRASYLMSFFGEVLSQPCNNCDNDLNKKHFVPDNPGIRASLTSFLETLPKYQRRILER